MSPLRFEDVKMENGPSILVESFFSGFDVIRGTTIEVGKDAKIATEAFETSPVEIDPFESIAYQRRRRGRGSGDPADAAAQEEETEERLSFFPPYDEEKKRKSHREERKASHFSLRWWKGEEEEGPFPSTTDDQPLAVLFLDHLQSNSSSAPRSSSPKDDSRRPSADSTDKSRRASTDKDSPRRPSADKAEEPSPTAAAASKNVDFSLPQRDLSFSDEDSDFGEGCLDDLDDFDASNEDLQKVSKWILASSFSAVSVEEEETAANAAADAAADSKRRSSSKAPSSSSQRQGESGLTTAALSDALVKVLSSGRGSAASRNRDSDGYTQLHTFLKPHRQPWEGRRSRCPRVETLETEDDATTTTGLWQRIERLFK